MQTRSVVVVASLGLASFVHGQQAVQWRVEDGGNGHWYRFVRNNPVQSVLWTSARDQAILAGGHLACIASDAENDFVWGLVPATTASWGGCGPRACGPHLGGFRAFPQSDPTLGWAWVDGSPWSYTRWAPTEPANLGGWQNYLKYWFDSQAPLPEWGDDGIQNSDSYIIEWSADCNGDGIVDYGQILNGTFADTNENGIPDCCDAGDSCAPCPGDVNDSGIVNATDIAIILGAWGTSGGKFPRSDTDGNGIVDAADLAVVLGGWGNCP